MVTVYSNHNFQLKPLGGAMERIHNLKIIGSKIIFRFSLKFFKTIKSATSARELFRIASDGSWIPVQTHKYATII